MCQRIQPVTLSTSITSSLLKRASTCTALSVYKICGSCSTFPPNPPSEKHTFHRLRKYPHQWCIKIQILKVNNNLTHADNWWSMKQPHQHRQHEAFPKYQGQSIPSMLHSSSDAPLPRIQNYLSSGKQNQKNVWNEFEDKR